MKTCGRRVVGGRGGGEGKQADGESERDNGWAKSRRREWIRNWYVSDWEGGGERGGLDWGVVGDMGVEKGGNKR